MSWSHKPAEWKPINHYCDPSAWLDGLNLVARRRIPVGSEITMDYATLHNELMEEFTCSCDSPDCSLIIRGTDFKEPFMGRYGEHVSNYVNAGRLAEKEELRPQTV